MNTSFGKATMAILILSLLLSSVDCYSVRAIEDPGDETISASDELIVIMKDGVEYRLETWTILEDGSVKGKGVLHRYHETPFDGVLQAHEIASFSLRSMNAGLTFVAGVIYVGATVGTIALLVAGFSDMTRGCRNFRL